MTIREIVNVVLYGKRAITLFRNSSEPDPADKELENLAQEDSDNLPRRTLMSMLVHWTYFRDLNVLEHVVAEKWDYSNPRAMKYANEHWGSYLLKEEESELKELGLAFLLRKRSHKNRNAPDLAILLRGTILTKTADLKADLEIGVQNLENSNRVLRTVRLILQVVERYLRENPEGQKDICMAGHSLGAAIALIVGGVLYSTHSIDIDTHLFNPPLVTVVDVVTVHHRPAPPADFDIARDNRVPDLKVNFAVLKEVFSSAFANKAAVDGKREKFKKLLKDVFVNAVVDEAAIDAEWAQFKKLKNWVPHFYLNPGDHVCRMYIDFYMGRQEKPLETPRDLISYQGLLSSLFSPNAELFKDVVPSADLHISHWKEGDARLAHSLQQWHKFKPKYITLEEVYSARLLRQKRSLIKGKRLFYKETSLRSR